MRALSIRARLSLWHLGVITAALALFGIASYAALRYALLQVKTRSMEAREQRLTLYLARNGGLQGEHSLFELLTNYASISHEGNLMQVLSLDGERLFPMDSTDSAWLTDPPSGCIHETFVNRTIDGRDSALLCHRIFLQGTPVRLYIASSLEENEYILDIYKRLLLFFVPCLLLVASAGGYFLSRRAMQPVEQMTKAAINISVNNLSGRLPLPTAQDELWDLARAWNQLLEQLEEAVKRLSRFSADASHDLRTSITVMLATAQLALRGERYKEEYRESLERIVSECHTASTLLDALLALARSENFLYEVKFCPVDLSELVLAGCRRVEELADSSGIILDWNLPQSAVTISGDAMLLHRLLGILLDNAIKYTPENGEIFVAVAEDGAGVSLEVRDSGIGMSEEVRQRVFERFYQADLRENKSDAGSGLGLAIALWIADAHRAKLTVQSQPMMGTRFRVAFPSCEMKALSAAAKAQSTRRTATTL